MRNLKRQLKGRRLKPQIIVYAFLIMVVVLIAIASAKATFAQDQRDAYKNAQMDRYIEHLERSNYGR